MVFLYLVLLRIWNFGDPKLCNGMYLYVEYIGLASIGHDISATNIYYFMLFLVLKYRVLYGPCEIQKNFVQPM